MLYACINGEKVEATRELRRGICEICEHEVIAKCGDIRIWHWAHKTSDCDPWSEPETAWHKNWKELFPREWREVRMENHRCDIRTPKYVIELQHSYLPPGEISARENFYGNIVWIFDMRSVLHRLDCPPQTAGRFRWPRFRKAIRFCKKPVFVHLARGALLHIYDYGLPPYHDYVSYRRFAKEEFLSSVGAPCENAVSPVTLENFTSTAVKSKKLDRESRWREHLLLTQPWLKGKI